MRKDERQFKKWKWKTRNYKIKQYKIKDLSEKFMPSKKKLFFFLYMYKMLQISKEGYKKWEVEIIDQGRYFWVKRKDLEVESDVAN